VTPAGHVQLDWRTISELNNYGFEVQRKGGTDSLFATLSNSFVPGHGTTNEPHDYSFTDSTVTRGEWLFRLRQIDLGGAIHYSDPVTASVLTAVEEEPLPTVYALHQNYPNPFNPTTIVSFSVPHSSFVSVKVYDVLGREIRTLVSENLQAGRYEKIFSAEGLASGVYYCRMSAVPATRQDLVLKNAQEFVATRRLMILK
jgi:hypothetical protein